MRDTVEAYSDLFFHGVLHHLPVHWASLGADDGHYDPPSRRYPWGIVRLSTDLTEDLWRGVLLHEMVHAAVALGEDVDEWEHGVVPYHGPRFAWACNYIGSRMGLREIDVEESWAWPWSALRYEPVLDDEE